MPQAFHFDDSRTSVIQDLFDYLRSTWPDHLKRRGTLPIVLLTVTYDDEVQGEHIDFWTAAENDEQKEYITTLLEQLGKSLKGDHVLKVPVRGT